MNKYYCKHCKQTFIIDSTATRIKSYCERSDKYVYLTKCRRTNKSNIDDKFINAVLTAIKNIFAKLDEAKNEELYDELIELKNLAVYLKKNDSWRSNKTSR